jgi:hypothetical protein
VRQVRQLGGFLRQYVVPRLKAIWTFKRAILAAVVALIGTLAAFATLVTFAPRFSVEPTTPLNPENPFSVPFAVMNTGAVAAKQVGYRCLLNEVTFSNGATIRESVAWDPRYKSIAELDPEERLEVPCQMFGPGIGSGFIVERGAVVVEADMTFHLSYRGAWRPWRQTEQFRFIYKPGPDNEVRWFAQPD